jgi:hypothetical protein
LVLLLGAIAVAFAACSHMSRCVNGRRRRGTALSRTTAPTRPLGAASRPAPRFHLTVDDAAQQVTHAGSDGKLPEQGSVVGVLRGPEPQRLTVTGTTADGEEVRFEFTVRPTGR